MAWGIDLVPCWLVNGRGKADRWQPVSTSSVGIVTDKVIHHVLERTNVAFVCPGSVTDQSVNVRCNAAVAVGLVSRVDGDGNTPLVAVRGATAETFIRSGICPEETCSYTVLTRTHRWQRRRPVQ